MEAITISNVAAIVALKKMTKGKHTKVAKMTKTSLLSSRLNTSYFNMEKVVNIAAPCNIATLSVKTFLPDSFVSTV
jgi:hypothetical protein